MLTPASRSHAPAGWRQVALSDGSAFSVPPDAKDQPATGVDSEFGLLLGDGYEIIYDYGRFGEALSDHEGEPDFTTRRRTVSGRPAEQVAYTMPGALRPQVHALQVRFDDRTLTLRLSCSEPERCARLADELFGSVSRPS